MANVREAFASGKTDDGPVIALAILIDTLGFCE